MKIDARTATRFWAKVDQSAGPSGCWRWLGTHNLAGGTCRIEWHANSRRPRFRLSGPSSGPGQKHVYVTRLMLALHDGVPLDQRDALFACHITICPNAWCINPAHLYWGTEEENLDDRYPARKSR